jgi:zinc transporter ZupT
VGAVLLVVGAAVFLWWAWHRLPRTAQHHTFQAFIAGAIAAGATAAGTLPVLARGTISARVRDMLLGFGAGVMLAASAFSLVLPGLAAAAAAGATRLQAGMVVGAGILCGALLLLLGGLALAAGAMLCVITHDVVPEIHRHGHERAATLALISGFVIMTVLDTAL